MPQVPAQLYSDESAIQYVPSGAVVAGDVVVLNGMIGIASSAIAASATGALQIEGIYQLPKTTAAWVRGLPVHWNPTGDPDNGTAGTGAANQLGVGTYAGISVETEASGDDTGAVNINVRPSNLLGVSAVTAAGSIISDAAALANGLNIVTGADGTKGVILPVAVAGMQVYIKGVTAGVLKVWPQSGGTINALSASAAISLASGAVPAIFVASSTTQWYTIPLLPS
jgi:predicted RecA/RadA family phage recombinase